MARKREHRVFANLFKTNPTQARAYREECLGIDRFDNKVGESKEEKKVEPIETTPEKKTEQTDDLLVVEYKKILTNAKVKFNPTCKMETLRKKCVEAGLID